MNISANFKLFRFERTIVKKENLQILTGFKMVYGHVSYLKVVFTDRFPLKSVYLRMRLSRQETRVLKLPAIISRSLYFILP